MPFDGLDAPPEWRGSPPVPRRPALPDERLTRREKVVAVLLGATLAALALAQCLLLVLLRRLNVRVVLAGVLVLVLASIILAIFRLGFAALYG